ncbi:hypothetical protein GW933_00530 [Candidatus Falkowbacteria bacterium]|uniref:Uncharacterized protein n=1 Tax=Candidatus Buchananbacteria bacterium CG10_big_fil_rev_8_21_14_0_10_33_19 TaxID=1974525 RepID=A0A2H0W315_9BACT|nr:hypothetical protein [Candidatus Falkowbacteria bacterium]PIS05745.1 MAG: hypothetical protein COT80_03155 [Candidatus Buchananbacteria bacterium CG10_big_fil_rev_8_21_14_0_10_33_19]
MKKILVIVILSIITSLVLISQSALAVYAPTEGDLVKLSYDSAIYYVNSAGERRLFVNAPTFWSWYSGSWSDQNIKTITQSEFDGLTVGKNMAVRPGTNLIKFQNSNNLYVVIPGNKLCKATTGYGDNWRDRLVTIQNSFENNYTVDINCHVDAGDKLPDGTVFRISSPGQLFYVENGKARIIQDTIGDDAFIKNRFQHKFVVKNVPQSMFEIDIQNTVANKEFWIDDIDNNSDIFSEAYGSFSLYLQCLKNYDKTCLRDLAAKASLDEFNTELDSVNFQQLADFEYSVLNVYEKSMFVNNWFDNHQLIMNADVQKDIADDQVTYKMRSLKFIKEDNKWKLIGASDIIIGWFTDIEAQDRIRDTDKDGLTDFNERCESGFSNCIKTDPLDRDSDDDGWWDGIEKSVQTDPNNANSKP